MSYLVFIKSGTHTAGPQPQTVTETQKAQATPNVTTPFDYSVHLQASTVTETQQAQATPNITALNYA